ncbi:hypothetical protein LSPH24S_09538 [Lysinibacillus sphaericus]
MQVSKGVEVLELEFKCTVDLIPRFYGIKTWPF